MTPGTPEVALVLGVAGTLLVYLELLRPRWILPGVTGVSLVMCAVARFTSFHSDTGSIPWLVAAVIMLVLECLGRFPLLPGIAGTAALAVGFAKLVPPAGGGVPAISTGCAAILGCLTVILAQFARAGREGKRSQRSLLGIPQVCADAEERTNGT